MDDSRLPPPSRWDAQPETRPPRWKVRAGRIGFFAFGAALTTIAIACLAGKITVDNGAGEPVSLAGRLIFSGISLVWGATMILTALTSTDEEILSTGDVSGEGENEVAVEIDDVDIDW
ncbi:hypothetical protein AGRA3207_005006 [Actinomadura graeca]|uniref:Uncharacterized protein n=1 Tax=Actinomadura graeca TaxID=2750812 RepID=A0ABX8QZP5_9ACTN|nr:hypothetical protein [Actinomadura graeca]QXJ23801.1 hypothetical protein AGRA3207_005006 [Actinomadura graeca]